MPTPDEMTAEEWTTLCHSHICKTCGHRVVLHNLHCCEFCQVKGCGCDNCHWDEREAAV